MALRWILGLPCAILVIVVLAQESSTSCCYGMRIKFKTNGFCVTVDSVKHEYYSHCESVICADGKTIKSGHFCGHGKCNVVGCNCEGGCRSGHWKKTFTERFKNKEIWFS
ncbi:protein Diedel-like [Drosophila bipectinata]|uniref:protein Diedel-like n=1 Tax=Drosophila bipectinata TaxID=42026 RepID=UPI0038B33384